MPAIGRSLVKLIEVGTWMSLDGNSKVTSELPEVVTWMTLAGN